MRTTDGKRVTHNTACGALDSLLVSAKLGNGDGSQNAEVSQ